MDLAVNIRCEHCGVSLHNRDRHESADGVAMCLREAFNYYDGQAGTPDGDCYYGKAANKGRSDSDE